MLPSSMRILLYRASVDMRLSFDGLESLVRVKMDEDPLSGSLFVFLNKRRDRAKLLMWDGTGWWIWYKRLEGGCFHFPLEEGGEIAASDLALLLEGIELAGARRQERWRLRRVV